MVVWGVCVCVCVCVCVAGLAGRDCEREGERQRMGHRGETGGEMGTLLYTHGRGVMQTVLGDGLSSSSE